MDIGACPHVPDSRGSISASRNEDVERGVKRQAVHAGKMAVVVSYHFVRLQIPTETRSADMQPIAVEVRAT